MNIYNRPAQDVIEFLNTDADNGLSLAVVDERRKIYGLNILPEQPQPSIVGLFIKQCQDPLIYLLLIAALIIIVMGHYTDAIVTLIVVLFNASLGTFHELNAWRTAEQLKRLMTVSALVIRDGAHVLVDASELVPGDLIFLQEGDRVPADARLIDVQHLRVNESVLTGEVASVEKQGDGLEGQRTIFEQTNMIFRGSTITSGTGRAIVAATGVLTEVGKLQQETQTEADAPSPLKEELNRLSHYLLLIASVLCGFLFLVGLVTGRPLSDVLALLTALFISIIPEGLPVVFTLALTAGARRLSKRHVLVKRLQAAEGLGRIDMLVIDKTGTLTRNEMVVQTFFADDKKYEVSGIGYFPEGYVLYEGVPVDVKEHKNVQLIADAADFLDDSEKKYIEETKSFQIKGEPTEAALGVFARKFGVEPSPYTIVHVEPFDFSIRLKMVFAERDNRLHMFVSGAPETLFNHLKHVSTGAKDALNEFLNQGFRAIALAHYEGPMPQVLDDWKELGRGLLDQSTLLALVGMQDAIRPEVRDAVLQARSSGIDVIMATGDHKLTAEHIARQTGILLPGDRVLTGEELVKALHDGHDISQARVFARVTPHEKLQLVKAIRRSDKIVAMTGDGINDIPSLVASSIGIAMGSGTDAAKEAADLVLMDDSFTSIMRGVEEGRHIFGTLRRVAWYFFSTNLSEVLVVFFAFVAGWPLPLRAAQILWLNVVTDGFLDVGLSMEPHEKGLLGTRWLSRGRAGRHHLLDGSLMTKIFIDAIVMTIGSLLMFRWWFPTDLAVAQTMLLVTMAIFQWFNAWNCRSETKSLFDGRLFANKPLIFATLLVLALQLLVVYVPGLQYLFKTVPLTFVQWGMIIMLASSIILVEEVRKAVVRWMRA